MKKWKNSFWRQEKTYIELVADNRKAVEEYNERMLSVLSQIGGFLFLMTLVTLPFSKTGTDAILIYLLAILIYSTLFFLCRLPSMKKYILLGLYIGFSAFFLMAVYFSVIHFPNMRATILLCGFCLMPLSFIDDPRRMNLFVVFWVVLHAILAIHLKPLYALGDIVNSVAFSVLGCFLGNIMVWTRLESYEVRRLLTIEKETDVLTGLSNRRKLFETLTALEAEDVEKPSGIFMVDIDHYKEFNDHYGHAAGDKCLGMVGEVMVKFMQNFRLHFYRYGGEEFVAMAYGYDEKELLSIAESLRISIQSMYYEEHPITVSIGAAYCGGEPILNYEKVIDRADKAAYAAKHMGRNRVCMEQRKIEEFVEMRYNCND